MLTPTVRFVLCAFFIGTCQRRKRSLNLSNFNAAIFFTRSSVFELWFLQKSFFISYQTHLKRFAFALAAVSITEQITVK
jgi:hypothetical protein